ncbi:carbonic anhydrase [uncultured Methanosphaera sp.]|jgi:carbonic anhydrase|uniref:beta-class carbonic anhydrase n=1 Tax=Methanosphaera sp. TaxID=2666342 RepID=UPI000DC55332|nr:carbonic anhydrase [uncultured Methanosphaera sp.]MDD6286447.1 carbonic anhydrase [Methanobacteriaceae archaeon]RAP45015.1 MAG: carbonic anhydrase [Methanosphaera sp. SHI1033]
MTKVLQEVLEANKKYAAEFGEKSKLPIPPGRKFSIVTCMDARLDPAKFAGLEEGDAHVIRNAGGRVTEDIIRSLIISHKLLGTQEWFIIHHTDCGMLTFTNDEIYDLLSESLESAAIGEDGWYNPVKEGGSEAGQYINFLPIKDLAKSVVDDVRTVRNHPLVPANIPIHGYIYEVETGKLVEVKEATEIGKQKNKEQDL